MMCGYRPPLRVLVSFTQSESTKNPYLAQLVDALPPDVSIAYFDWQTALRGGYQVLHLHWPDALIRGRGRLYSWRRRLALRYLLWRCRHRRVAVVRTLHNKQPHEEVGAAGQRVLRRVDLETDLWISLNEDLATPTNKPTVVIPHGHYRQWFSGYQQAEAVPGRILFFGLIRPYKQVPQLISAFREITEEGFSLSIHGSAKDQEQAAQIKALAQQDPRVAVDLTRLSDPELVAEVTSAELVVLPYRDLFNSGVALLALSLDRPILVPESATTMALAEEVGTGFVQTFSGRLSGADIVAAVESARAMPPGAKAELSARDWPEAGQMHAAAYRRAVADKRHA